MADRTVAVRLLAKVDSYKADMAKASAATQTFAKQAGGHMKSATKAASELSTGTQLAAAGVLTAMGLMAKSSISAASNLQETASKTAVLFGQSSSAIDAWAGKAADSFGQSKQQAMDAAATFAVFGKSAGLSGESLVGFSTDLTELASDMASFSNTTPQQAIEAIGAALRGESEPIRQYGVLLDDATLRNEAFAMGLTKTTKNVLTPQQRVLAAQAAIMKQTGAAQGDFARTSDGLANSQRTLNAQWQDAQASLGEALLPAAIAATNAMKGLLDVVKGAPTPLTLAVAGVVAAGAGFIVLAPRVIAAKQAFDALAVSAPRTAAALGTVGKAFGLIAVGAVAGMAAFNAFMGDTGGKADGGMVRLRDDMISVKDAVEMLANPGLGDRINDFAGEVLTLGSSEGRGDRTELVNGLRAIDSQLSGMVAGGNAAGAAAAVKAMGLSAAEASVAFPGYTAALNAAGGATGKVATEATRAAAAVRVMDAAWRAAMGALSMTEALIAQEKATKEWTTSLQTNGATLNRHTAAGQANIAALSSNVQAIDGVRQSLISQGMSSERAAGQAKLMLKPLRDTYIAAGGTAASFDALTASVAKTPKAHTTTVKAPGLSAAEISARRYRADLDNLDGRVVNTTVRTTREIVTNPFGTAAATGGYISGPGTKTSDSIPAWLSTGEYVIKAAAVDKYGIAMMDRINARGFAAGGTPTPAQAAAASMRTDRASAAAIVAAQRIERQLRSLSAESLARLRAMAPAERLAAASSLARGGARAQRGYNTTTAALNSDRAAEERAEAAKRAAEEAAQAVADSQKKITDLYEARAQEVASVTERLIGQSSLLGSHDFGREATALRDLASAKAEVTKAEEDYFEARRAVNTAGTPEEQAAATKRLAEAQKALAAARGNVVTAEQAAADAANTPSNVLKSFQAKAAALSAFRSNIQTLATRGLDRSILQQLIAAGVDGAQMAATLVAMTPDQITAVNDTQARIRSDSTALADITAGITYDPAIQQAQNEYSSLVSGMRLNAQTIQIQGSQPIVVNVDSRQVYAALLELARRSGGTLSWVAR